MGVYIKGMEMPEKGYIDVRLFADGWAHVPTAEQPYTKAFEAIHVSPHGRLIDADALLARAKELSGPMTGDGWDNLGVYSLIEGATTIIPAGEEEGS